MKTIISLLHIAVTVAVAAPLVTVSQAPFAVSGSPLEQYEQARKGAESGIPAAQFLLGEFLNKGRAVKADFAAAEEWYYRSATNGFIAGQMMMGRLMRPRDTMASLRWYFIPANGGDAGAQFMVGTYFDRQNFRVNNNQDGEVIYKWGEPPPSGIAPDWSAARRWYEKAAAQGHAGALNNLGVLYYIGQGVKPDLVTAQSYFRRAAQKENPWAIQNAQIAETFMTPKQSDDAKRLAAVR